MKTATKKKTRVHRPKPVYVIVPKTQMRAKSPAMLLDPARVESDAVTASPSLAIKFGTRSGAFRHVKRSRLLTARFWYRRILV